MTDLKSSRHSSSGHHVAISSSKSSDDDKKRRHRSTSLNRSRHKSRKSKSRSRSRDSLESLGAVENGQSRHRSKKDRTHKSLKDRAKSLDLKLTSARSLEGLVQSIKEKSSSHSKHGRSRKDRHHDSLGGSRHGRSRSRSPRVGSSRSLETGLDHHSKKSKHSKHHHGHHHGSRKKSRHHDLLGGSHSAHERKRDRSNESLGRRGHSTHGKSSNHDLLGGSHSTHERKRDRSNESLGRRGYPSHESAGDLGSKLHSTSRSRHKSAGDPSSQLHSKGHSGYRANAAWGIDMTGQRRMISLSKEDRGITPKSDKSHDSPKADKSHDRARRAREDAEAKRRGRRPGSSRSTSPNLLDKHSKKSISRSRATRPGVEDVSSGHRDKGAEKARRAKSSGIAVGVVSSDSHHRRPTCSRSFGPGMQSVSDDKDRAFGKTKRSRSFAPSPAMAGKHTTLDRNTTLHGAPPTPTDKLSKELSPASNGLPLAAEAVDETQNEEKFDRKVQEAVDRMMKDKEEKDGRDSRTIDDVFEKLNISVAESSQERRKRVIFRVVMLVIVLVGGLAIWISLRRQNIELAAKQHQKYKPPSEEDCQAIEDQKSVTGQEDMVQIKVVIEIEIVLDSEEDIDVFFAALASAVQDTIVPELTGCTEGTRRSLEELQPARFLRRALQEETRPYPIGNANTTADYEIGESCSTNVTEPCFRATGNLNLDLFVREGADASEFMPMVAAAFTPDENQTIIEKLGLDEFGFQEINFVGEIDNGPLDEKSSAPTATAIDVSNEPTTSLTGLEPTPPPITPPPTIPGATLSPTAPPTPGPTKAFGPPPTTPPPTIPGATLSPTAPPTPGPTKAPTPSPTKAPTPPPSNPPSTPAGATPSPTTPLTPGPTKVPTPSPTKAPTPPPTTPSPTLPGATPSPTTPPTPGPTKAPTPPPTLPPTPPPTTPPPTLPGSTPSPTTPLTPGPTKAPTPSPTKAPTPVPSTQPSVSPSARPSLSPTESPSLRPSASPSTDSPSSTPSISPTQRNVLMDIYNTANGSFGSPTVGWQGTGNECDWNYIFCDFNGNVFSIMLGFKDLSGSISTRIAELPALASFDMSYNSNLGGALPAQLFTMTQLSYIYLHNNNLVGSIPAAVGNLSNLKSFWINGNGLTGQIPNEFSSLVQLTYIAMHENSFGGTIPATIGALTALSRVDLYKNSIGGTIPAAVSQLTNLVELYLHENQLSGTLPALLSSQLTVLDLHSNQLTGTIPAAIGVLPLRTLNFASNDLSGSIPTLPATLWYCYLGVTYDLSNPEQNCFSNTTNLGSCSYTSNGCP